MKKFVFMFILFVASVCSANAQAEIKFDKLTHNFGKFPESSPKVTCVFTFTNVGDQPLVINQAVASCGCTVPEYTKAPIKPGESGLSWFDGSLGVFRHSAPATCHGLVDY